MDKTNNFEQTHFNRIGGRLGTPLAAGNFAALHANWGGTATLAITAGSTDMSGEITVTASATTPGANPTVVLTFADGAFDAAPKVVCSRTGGTGQRGVQFEAVATTTTLTLTFPGTPVAGETHKVTWLAVA